MKNGVPIDFELQFDITKAKIILKDNFALMNDSNCEARCPGFLSNRINKISCPGKARLYDIGLR